MTRLSQSRRQKIGQTYKPQVQNDIAISPNLRQMVSVQNQAFEQNMNGSGDNIRGSGLIKPEKKQRIEDIVSNITFQSKEQISKAVEKLKSDPRISNLIQKSSIGDLSSTIGKAVDEHSGEGILPSTKPPQEGMLPGDLLRKKLLKKMVRERKMKSLGDRLKTPSVGLSGGANVISGTSSGQSRDKTLPDTSSFKLDPKPLVGAGQQGGFFFLLPAIMAAVSAAATGAAGAAGALLVKEVAGSGMKGNGVADFVKKAIQKTKLTIEDLPAPDKKVLKEGFEVLKKNPTKSGIISFGKKIAPIARKVVLQKVQDKIQGKGLSLAGQGLTLAGQGNDVKKFDKDFLKVFTHQVMKTARKVRG